MTLAIRRSVNCRWTIGKVQGSHPQRSPTSQQFRDVRRHRLTRALHLLSSSSRPTASHQVRVRARAGPSSCDRVSEAMLASDMGALRSNRFTHCAKPVSTARDWSGAVSSVTEGPIRHRSESFRSWPAENALVGFLCTGSLLPSVRPKFPQLSQ